MRVRWRFGLVAIIAVAVVGGFTPHGVVAGADTTATEMVQIAQSPVSMPLNCMDVTCGKGSPAPAAPTPTVALAAVLAGITAAAGVITVIRRHRHGVEVLPAGSRDPLFHPPQFS